MNRVQYRRVFCGVGAQGDTAAIFGPEIHALEENRLKIAQKTQASVSCFISPSNDADWQVRIFDKIREVDFCGHGLLASADLLLLGSMSQTLTLWTPTQTVHVSQKKGDIRLSLTKTELKSVSLSEAPLAFISSVISIAQTPNDRGYWVVELEEDVNLADWNSNLLSSSHLGGRALILTQRGGESEFDYKFRYFAPQYGVDESPASGSANAVLLSYWSQTLRQRQFRSIQLSSGRAVHMGGVDNEKYVWISGDIEPYKSYINCKVI